MGIGAGDAADGRRTVAVIFGVVGGVDVGARGRPVPPRTGRHLRRPQCGRGRRRSSYKFDSPAAIAAVGSNLFVTNSVSDTVTEVDASTGSLVRVISGSSYKFDYPVAIAAVGSDLFVANSGGQSVTAFSVS